MESLSEAASLDFLARNHLGRLGCFSPSQGQVYVVPLAYQLKGRAVEFISIAGQKLRFLREHPDGICLEVDEVDSERNWTSVIATGHFEELTGSERLERENEAFYRASSGPLRFALTDADIYRGAEPAVIWRLRIEALSGRRERWGFEQSYRYW